MPCTRIGEQADACLPIGALPNLLKLLELVHAARRAPAGLRCRGSWGGRSHWKSEETQRLG